MKKKQREELKQKAFAQGDSWSHSQGPKPWIFPVDLVMNIWGNVCHPVFVVKRPCSKVDGLDVPGSFGVGLYHWIMSAQVMEAEDWGNGAYWVQCLDKITRNSSWKCLHHDKG